jgi:hypothetical protein
MERDIRCSGCGNRVSDGSSPCPDCGDTRKSISVSAKNDLTFMEELGLQARDAEDRLRREFQSRTDGTKEGFVDRDLTGPEEVIRRTGTRSGPLLNFDEETKYVEAFVSSLNLQSGRSYEVEPKGEEDSGFPDRWLIDRTLPDKSADQRIGVEVTHLDQGLSPGSRGTGDSMPRIRWKRSSHRPPRRLPRSARSSPGPHPGPFSFSSAPIRCPRPCRASSERHSSPRPLRLTSSRSGWPPSGSRPFGSCRGFSSGRRATGRSQMTLLCRPHQGGRHQ